MSSGDIGQSIEKILPTDKAAGSCSLNIFFSIFIHFFINKPLSYKNFVKLCYKHFSFFSLNNIKSIFHNDKHRLELSDEYIFTVVKVQILKHFC